jgi:hypothetical protein
MSGHPLLADFQKECQSIFACYVFATRGIEHAKEMIVSTSPPPKVHASSLAKLIQMKSEPRQLY